MTGGIIDTLFPNAKGKLTVRFGHAAYSAVQKINPALLDDPRVSVSAEVPLAVVKIEDDAGHVTTLTLRNY